MDSGQSRETLSSPNSHDPIWGLPSLPLIGAESKAAGVLSFVEVKNEWSHTTIPCSVYIARYITKHTYGRTFSYPGYYKHRHNLDLVLHQWPMLVTDALCRLVSSDRHFTASSERFYDPPVCPELPSVSAVQCHAAD